MRALIAALMLVLSTTVAAQSTEFHLKYKENAGFIKFYKGDKSGSAVCLVNRTEAANPEALPDGWRAVTCNDLNTPVSWHLCYINVEKGSFICGVKPS
jgi:hypothetical protein